MPITFDEFLRAHHFVHDPFGTTNAEQERAHLSSYFVRVSWFDRIVGDPAYPESLILFAPRGHGKTIHRLEVARLASSFRNKPALVVSFTDFDLLLKDNTKVVDIESYLRIIRQKTLEALDQQLIQQRDQEGAFKENEIAFARFYALLYLFVPLRAVRRKARTDLVNDYVQAYQQTVFSLKDWLKELSDIVQQAGFSSVYFLIDGIDEWTKTSNNLTDVAPELLRPLLDAPGVLQECGFAFKFFLPDTLEDAMWDHRVGRLERLPIYRLTWTENELFMMLSRRLTASSPVSDTSGTGYVNRLSDICEVPQADEYLVRDVYPSPRRLIDRARQLLINHCLDASDPDALISEATFRTIVTHLPVEPMTVSVPAPVSADTSVSGVASTVATRHQLVPLLRLDKAGQIWLGDHLITDEPGKLSRLMRICIEFLWTHRGTTVRYTQLQQALYPEDHDIRQDPKASCDKIIRNLRGLIESGNKKSQQYIAVQPGIGYILRNFQGDVMDE